MRNQKLVAVSVMAVAAALAGISTPAWAQAQVSNPTPQAADGEDAVADIVVTAQRRSESINRVPMAIQALSGDSLKSLRIQNAKDLASAVPGLQVAPAYSGVPIFSLRGIGFNTTNITATATVGIYQDELAYPYPSMAGGPIYDVQRVEVLKGPQGTLYGRNTTAGLIDFITNKPGRDFAGGVTVEGGNYETYNFEGYLNLPVSDSLAVRFSGRSENSDKGWQIDQSRGDRLGKVQRWGARGELAFEPGDRFSAFLSVSGWKDRSDTQAGQAISLNLTNRINPLIGGSNAPGLIAYLANNQPDSASDAGFDSLAHRSAQVGLAPGMGRPRADSSFISGQLKLTWTPIDQISIISLTGYSDFKRNDVVDFSGVPYEIVATQYDARIKSFSQELRAETEGPGFRFTLGGYYGRDTLRENSRYPINDNSSVRYLRAAALQIISTPALNALFNTPGYTAADIATGFRSGANRANGYNETMSAFFNGELEVTDQLKLLGGLRYGMDHNRLDGCSTDLNGNYLPIVNTAGRAVIFQSFGVLAPLVEANHCTTYDPTTNSHHIVRNDLDQDNLSGRIAVNYQIRPSTLLYASFSRGVKSGVIPILPANRAVQFSPAGQEKLSAYEAGIKTDIAGRLIHLDLAGFYYDYRDKQFSSYVPDPVFGALQRLVNIPKSRAWGIDGTLTLRPAEALTLTANATYLDTKIKNYVGANAAGRPQDYSGATFSNAPKFMTSGTAVLNLPLSADFLFQTTANVTYQTKSHSDFGEDPLFRIKGYALVNGSIGIAHADGRYSLTFWARNLTNEYYWTSVVDNQNLNVRYAGRPRTFGASLSYNF